MQDEVEVEAHRQQLRHAFILPEGCEQLHNWVWTGEQISHVKAWLGWVYGRVDYGSLMHVAQKRGVEWARGLESHAYREYGKKLAKQEQWSL